LRDFNCAVQKNFLIRSKLHAHKARKAHYSRAFLALWDLLHCNVAAGSFETLAVIENYAQQHSVHGIPAPTRRIC
jgi:hypothetical protein